VKRLAVIPLGLLALAGCRSATEISVEVQADGEVCPLVVQTGLVAGTLETYETRPLTSVATGCTGGHIGSVVLVPSGGSDDDLAFRVVASLDRNATCNPPDYGPKCIVARRALHYLAHDTLKVIVSLGAACEGVPCSSTETCVGGTCVSATIVDPSQCEGNGCGDGILSPADGGDGGDAGHAPSDGGVDATLPPPGDGGEDGGSIDGAPPPFDASGIVLSLGEKHSCALLLDGTVKCWGDDTTGQLGIGDAGASATDVPPTLVPGISNVVAFGSGSPGNHTCAGQADGGVFCWGANGSNQLGFIGPASAVPVAVPATLPVLGALSVGQYATCATSATRDQLFCWGDWGTQTAPGTLVPSATGPFLSVSTGPQLVCIANGTAGQCWGSDVNGQEGDPTSPSDPTAPVGLDPVQIALGTTGACAVRPDRTLACWAYCDELQCGFDGGTEVAMPTTVPGMVDVVQVTAGQFHTCVLHGDGGVDCFGDNNSGQTGAASDPSPPTHVSGLGPATSIAAGSNHTCAVVAGTSVYCWGANGEGELGTPAAGGGPTPLRVPL
jgi:hypothetical protein